MRPEYAMAIKRLIDCLVAAVLLLFTLPLLVILALLIRLSMGRPVLFCQVRPGLHGRLFTLYKFRTMCDVPAPGEPPLTDSERLTRLGAFLRRYSLDELPQLWNVLKGDMSLVGPRPLLVEYLARYNPEHRRRHAVRPGITGLAQIKGRQNLTFSQRLNYDVWYVDHRSFWLDMRILCLTALRVATTSGVRLQQEVAEVDDLGLSQAAQSPDMALVQDPPERLTHDPRTL